MAKWECLSLGIHSIKGVYYKAIVIVTIKCILLPTES